MENALEQLRKVTTALRTSGFARQADDIEGLSEALKATKEKVLPALDTFLTTILPEVTDSEGNIKLGWSMLNPANWGKLGRIAKATITFVQAVIAAYKQA